MLLWKAYRRNPLFLGLHETINRYMKSVLQKQHAFEQFFLYIFTLSIVTSEIIYLSLDAINFNCNHLFTLIFTPHLIDHSPIILRPFSLRSLHAFLVACCPFSLSFNARICRRLLPFFVIVRCPLLLSFAVCFCHPSRLLLLSIVVVRHLHSSSFIALRLMR